MSDSFWARRSPGARAVLGIGMGWGPGIVIGAVLWLVTSHWYLGVLDFAIACALTTLILGSVGATLLKKREQSSGTGKPEN